MWWKPTQFCKEIWKLDNFNYYKIFTVLKLIEYLSLLWTIFFNLPLKAA